MKEEIKQALALELTKAVIAKRIDECHKATDPTNPYEWVKTYMNSEKQIEEASKRLNPKKPMNIRAPIKGFF